MTTATRLYYTSRHNVWDSSVIDTLFYDAESRNLYVDFVNHPDSRVYYDVPVSTWVGFRDAVSKGQYYNLNVKYLFKSDRFDLSDLSERATGNSTGPHLSINAQPALNNYTIKFTIAGSEGEVNVSAPDDNDALRQLDSLAGQLNVAYVVTSLTRQF